MENRPGAVDDLTRLYRDAIKQHAANPVGFGQQIDATHRHEEFNPLCGDRVLVLLRVVDEQLEAAAFDGEACAICMASASLLCEHAPGMPVSELHEMSDQLHEALVRAPHGREGFGPDEEVVQKSHNQDQEQKLRAHGALLQPLLGVKPFPSRIRCATLPWVAAVTALSDDSSVD